MKRTIYVFGMLIMLSLGLAAQDTEGLQKIVIGGDYNYPPYEFVNAQGEPDGYNVELAELSAGTWGWSLSSSSLNGP